MVAATPTTPTPSTEDVSLGGVFVQKPAAGVATDNDEGGGAFPPGSTGGGGAGGVVVDPANDAEITISITADGTTAPQGSFTVNQASDAVLAFDLSAQITTLIENEVAGLTTPDGVRVSSIDYTAPTETETGSIVFNFAQPGTFTGGNTGPDGNAVRTLTLPAVGTGGGGGLTEAEVNMLIANALLAVEYPYATTVEISNSDLPLISAVSDTASDTDRSLSIDIATLIPDAVTGAITTLTSTDNSVDVTGTGTSRNLASRPILRGNSNTLSAGDTSTIIPASQTINFAELSIDGSTGLVLVEVSTGRYALVAEGTTPVIPVNPPETEGITGDSTIFETAPNIVLTVTANMPITGSTNPSAILTRPDGTTQVIAATTGGSGNNLTLTVIGTDAQDPGTYTLSITPETADGALDAVTDSVMRTIPYVTYRGTANEPTGVLDITQTTTGTVVAAGWPADGTIPVPTGTGAVFIAVHDAEVDTTVNRVVYTNGSQVLLNVRSRRELDLTAGTERVNYNVIQIAGSLTGGTLSMFQTV